jgi:two-component system, NarL family, invasion response regulator UvrY
MIKILIADDHAVVREGLKATIQDMPGMGVVAEAKNGQEVLDIVRTHQVDVIILDLTMPGRSGLDTLLHLKREHPELPVLIVTLHSEEQYGRRLLRSGAHGYLSKACAPEQLEAALRVVAQGKKYVTPTLAEKLATDLVSPQSVPPHASLSDREYEILLLIGQGHTPKEVAYRLSLSPKTVMTYRIRILEKLKMKTTADLIHYAVEHRLLEQPLVIR